MNKKLVLLGAAVLLTGGSMFAQKRVTGRVADADGNPIVGASVRFEGQKGVVLTDDNGRFTLTNVPASAKRIRVSYIGKETKTVSVAGNLDVTLEDNDHSLDEAVVIGYGKVKKGDFTGSVSAVKGEKIQKMQVSNLSKALEGVLPGVQLSSNTGQPGESAAIYVRGIGSINANKQPLIILDGAPYEGSLNSINPADIESINLQKDASATSIYGARGSNGILYITTKQGRQGKTQVTFDAKWGWNGRAVPEYAKVTSEKDFYELTWESYYNRNRFRGGMSDLDARVSASSTLVKELGGYNSYNVADYLLIDPMTGRLNPSASLLYHEDWNDAAFESGLRQEYNVGISGGNDKTKYYLSFNYLNDKAYVQKSDFDRMTGRLRVDHQAFNWLTVGANVSYAHTKLSGISMGSGLASNLFAFTQYIAPIYPVYLHGLDGQLVLDENGQPQLDLGSEYGRTRLYNLGRNPLIEVYNNTNKSTTDAFNARGYADVKIYDGLTFRADVAIDNFQTWSDEFNAPITPDAASVNGRGLKTSSRTSVVNATQRLNYEKTFGGLHSLSLMAAHETKAQYMKRLEASRAQFFIPENNFSNSLVDSDDPSSSDNAYHLESWLGRAEYSYAHRYSLSATFRRDGSSMFAPENRWGNFWSVGAAWNIGEEAWFKDALTAFDNLKLRASYGTQGNDGIPYYGAYLDQYSVSNGGTTENPEFSIQQVWRGNRELTWEQSKTFDVGLEFGILGRRLTGELDFFVKNTDDMIGFHTLPMSQGSPSSILTNEQAMRNTGFEATITAVPVQTQKVRWDVTLNLTHYKNELTRMQEGRPDEGFQTGNYWRKKGFSLYEWSMARYAGVDPQTGEGLYYKTVATMADGSKQDVQYLETFKAQHAGEDYTLEETTTADATTATTYILGKSSLPTLFGGLSTTLQAYGFDLTVSTAFSLGGWTYDSSYASLMSGGNGSTYSTDIFKRWQKPGDVTDVPRLADGDRMTGGVTNDRFLTRSDYFSLRNVTLGYTLPASVVGRVPGFTEVRIYAVGDNLFLGSHRKGLDPRQYIDGRVDSNSYSALRTISFGVNLTF